MHLPLSLIICSNRARNLQRHAEANLSSLRPGDSLIVIFDNHETIEDRRILEPLRAKGGEVIVNGRNRGLAYSRNVALTTLSARHVIFVDDDVRISTETIEDIRAAFEAGFEVVGAKICLAVNCKPLPWYISEGQLHYLAIHTSRSLGRIWGACMGLDLRFAREHLVTFKQELGRKGVGLQSGEDTSFIQEMTTAGAKDKFLTSSFVLHDIEKGKLSLSYLLRRAYWQGRSEVRRRNVRTGFKKEVLRYFSTESPLHCRCCLAALYGLLLLLGIVVESVSSRATAGIKIFSIQVSEQLYHALQ